MESESIAELSLESDRRISSENIVFENSAPSKSGLDEVEREYGQNLFNHEILTAKQERDIAYGMRASLKGYAESILNCGGAAEYLGVRMMNMKQANIRTEIGKLFFDEEKALVEYKEVIPKVSELVKKSRELLSGESAFDSDVQKQIWDIRKKHHDLFVAWKPKVRALEMLLEGDAYFPGLDAYAIAMTKNFKDMPQGELKKLRIGVVAETAMLPDDLIAFADEARNFRQKYFEGRDEMILHNQKLVAYMAGKYKFVTSYGSLDFGDLVSAGQVGLQKAVEMFDPDRGFKFSTYAIWWTKQSISRYVQDTSRTVRNPVHIGALLIKMSRAIESYQNEEGSNKMPEIEDLAQMIDCPVKTIKLLLAARKSVSSLDAKMDYSDGTGDEMHNFIYDGNAQSPSDEADRIVLSERLNIAMEGLNSKEKTVINYRFGINGCDTMTLEEVGEKFQVTRERIRQIEAKALKKLRHPKRIAMLRTAYEHLI